MFNIYHFAGSNKIIFRSKLFNSIVIVILVFFVGSQILLEKLQKFKPKIAVFNGKLIFEVFSGKKDFSFGRQPELVDGTNTVSVYILNLAVCRPHGT